MTEAALDKKTIITELTKSPHGDLAAYLPIGVRAAREDADFFAHLVAYNHVKGQVRDAQVALPVIALAECAERRGEFMADYVDNALAHLADLTPRMLAQALLERRRSIKPKTAPKKGEKVKTDVVTYPAFINVAHAPKRLVRRFVTRYLRDLEADRREFERAAVQHATPLRNLYAHFHVSRPDWVGQILFSGEKGQSKARPEYGIFDAIRRLPLMGAEEAAGTIMKFHIPFLNARGALGAKAKDPDTVLALIKAMSPTELVTNIKWLDRLGVKTNPALRAAFDAAVGKASKSKTPKATLKTTKAADVMADDEALSGKLKALQETQIDALGGIDGNWLVMGDRSGSMKESIEVAKELAGVLARVVKGNVYLVFFDTTPIFIDVTGKTLDEIKKATRGIKDGGGTSFACALQTVMDKKLSIDGIAIVSDGGENSPAGGFAATYQRYARLNDDQQPTVFWYRVNGDIAAYRNYGSTLEREITAFRDSCRRANIDVQEYDLTKGVDYYSLPNLAQTMRVARYALLDEVQATPLRTLDEVLTRTNGMSVLPKQLVTA